MARYPTLTGAYAEGGAVAVETQLTVPVGVGVNEKVRITDFTVAGDAAAWFWLSGSPAGVFGHWQALYLPAAGTFQVSFESPLEVNGPSTVYCHYDSATLGTAFAAAWSGEMFV